MIPDFFKTAALAAVEQLINQSLKFDPTTLHIITRLQGKIIAIECTLPPLSFFIQHHSEGIQLSPNIEGSADTTLKGSALSLASLATNSQQATSLYGTGVEVTGDQALLQTMSNALGNLDIDWEAALAKLTGDVPAHLVGESLRSTSKWGKQASDRASKTASGFTVEEVRLLPGRNEINTFSEQVKLLNKDTERLSAKINKLKVQINRLSERH